MPQAIAAQSADVLTPPPALPALPAPPAPQALPAQPAQPAKPAQPAIPAIPAIPAVPAIPAIPPIAASPPTTAKIWTTAPPTYGAWSTGPTYRDLVSDAFQLGLFLLVLPFAIALARRVWSRSGPRPVIDLENSPRLERIEQAIESIAVEVERIGEAQRFTTKLLAEREPLVARIPPSASPPRRDPGTITPH